VEGLLETLLPNGSPLSDFGNTLPGKLLTGIAGVRPAQPNTAGEDESPLKSPAVGGGQSLPSMGDDSSSGGGDTYHFFHGEMNLYPRDMDDFKAQITGHVNNQWQPVVGQFGSG
jgi:hypothetical protein